MWQLPKPVVLLTSSNAFSFRYQYKVTLLHIRRLITGTGTSVLITFSCD
jgi:hypothetical protein